MKAPVDPRLEGARCDLCPLAVKGKAVSPVFASEPRKPLRLVVVGEAPGRVEVRHGAPFLGPSGRLVDRMFEDAGDYSLRSSSYLTNASLCRGDVDKDNEAAAVCCAPRLHRELLPLPKEVPILALGKAAAKSILNVKSILMTRGFVWETKEIDETVINAARRKADKTKDPVDRLKAVTVERRAKLAGRVVLPSIHPAFVLRADNWKPVLQVDIRRVVRFVKGELTLKDVPIAGPYVVVSKVNETRTALAKLKDVVAVDIETDGIDPYIAGILCVGISDGDKTVVVDWTDSPALALVVSKFLKSRRQVVMHNGFGFDQICMRRHGVTFNPANLHDTLQAHHTFASHLPQRLDQVVSEFMDSMPWKIKFGRRGAAEKGMAPHKMPKEELWMYCAGDVWRTAIIWDRMQADLADDMAVYLHDCETALICQDMQMTGIKMDVKHRDYLAQKMRKRAAAIKGNMRKLVGKADFSPTRTNDIRWALFTKFKAPILTTVKGSVTQTGLASTASGVLEAFASQKTRAGRLSNYILNWRGVTKIKATYLDAIQLGGDHRARVSWRPWGTVSGRWASRLQSTPRKAVNKITKKVLLESRVREVYVAEDGWEFVYFDIGQAEMRFAAYLSGDERFIAEMCSSDPYLERAKMLFPKARDILEDIDPATRKPRSALANEFRQIAKIASLAKNYLAEPEQIFAKMRQDGFDAQFSHVVAAFDAIERNYRQYFRYVEKNVEFCKRWGYIPTPIMFRKCRLGFFPKATDVANRPIQGGIADVMNMRLIEVNGILREKDLLPQARLVLQIHDACVFECRKKISSDVNQILKDVWAKPVIIKKSPVCAEERSFVLPIDQKTKERWSEL